MPPMAAAEATPDPLMEPNSMLATTLVWARGPGRKLLTILAQLISRMAMPPLFIRLPARMKKGMANRAKESRPTKTRWAEVRMAPSNGRIIAIARKEESPILMLMGVPMNSRINAPMNITSATTTGISMVTPFA